MLVGRNGHFIGGDGVRKLRAAGWAAMVAMLVLAGAVGCASATGASSSASASASASGPPHDGMSDISCVMASFCVAVGFDDNSASGKQGVLAEEWNGSRWRPLRSASGGFLAAVSCTSTAFCMAVGRLGISDHAEAEEWNGSGWRRLRIPVGIWNASSVSCVGSSFCMATGGSPMVWNGQTWRTIKVPASFCPAPHIHAACGLFQVSCLRARNCMAIGWTTALAWNGKSWRETNWPDPDRDAVLRLISCSVASGCLAVGYCDHRTSSCDPVLALAWNGRTWRELVTPDTDGPPAALSCPGASNCVAVGGINRSGRGVALLQNGAKWRTEQDAAPGHLFGISCWRVYRCVEVGFYSDAAGATLTLAELWDGALWTRMHTSNP